MEILRTFASDFPPSVPPLCDMVRNHEPATALHDTITVEVRKILLSFFHRSGIVSRLSYKGVPTAVKDGLQAVANSCSLGLSDRHFDRYGTVGLVMATTAYQHTPFEVQVAIALYTLLVTIIDDDDILTTQMISDFPMRFFDARPQPHPVLTRYAEVIAKWPREHFTMYSANIITTNSVDFVSAEMLGRDETQSGPKVKAIEFADYIRMKNGLGDTYAAFIWPREMFPRTGTYVQAFPHVSEYICWANDLYSFYKEAKNGETDNYVSQFAAIHGQTPLEAVKTVSEKVLAVDSRIKNLLGDGAERKAWECFATGYAEFHLHTPRYHLRDLLPELYLRV